MKYLMNTPELVDRRRGLRQSQTEAERKVWEVLKSRRLGNFKFRRQFSVGAYILDFYCPKHKLCVELDGGQHASNVEYDSERTKFLNDQGITVVRFWNNDVLKNPEGVYDELLGKLNTSPRPSPNLGEGGAARRAFTLIELLVVIAIIGLLSTVAVVSTNGAQVNARNNKRKADMLQISKALELYYNDNGGYPDTGGGWHDNCTNFTSYPNSGAGAWVPNFQNYMAVLPSDPRSGKPNPSNQGNGVCRTDGGNNCYIYRSNITDYKLNADCTPEGPISASDPFQDPARPSQDYSVYTPGARLVIYEAQSFYPHRTPRRHRHHRLIVDGRGHSDRFFASQGPDRQGAAI